jgi:hypothetical protein
MTDYYTIPYERLCFYVKWGLENNQNTHRITRHNLPELCRAIRSYDRKYRIVQVSDYKACVVEVI